jgi:hypothetical protein
MNRGIFGLALGMVVLSVAPASAQLRPRRDQDAGRYGWLPSLSTGKAQAQKSGKPLMVVLRCVP